MDSVAYKWIPLTTLFICSFYPLCERKVEIKQLTAENIRMILRRRKHDEYYYNVNDVKFEEPSKKSNERFLFASEKNRI